MNNPQQRHKVKLSDSRQRTATLAPQQAVQEYLDALLQEATAQARVETESKIEIVESVQTSLKSVVADATVPGTVTSEKTARVKTAPVEVVPAPAIDVSQAAPIASNAFDETATSAVEEAASESLREWRNGRPGWAQEKFECLLFKVAGLTLAVPLKELGGVLTMEEDLTPLFGQPEWFLGLLPSKTAGTVKTIDTARWVMPEKYDDEMAETLNYQYLIMLDESNWGLAAEKLVETELIQPEDVKWRSQPGKRPWLLGTIKEKMCALLHVGDLIAMLEQGVNGQAR